MKKQTVTVDLRNRPPDEPHSAYRTDGLFYTQLSIRPSKTSTEGWAEIYFFRSDKEPIGWYRYAKPNYDWYIESAVEKLNKLSAEEQAQITSSIAMGLRHAIREKYQKGEGAKQYELPSCRNTLSAVIKWTEGTFKKYGPNLDES